MAEAVVLHGVLVALALADEVDDDLHLLGEPQRFDLDRLARHVAVGAALKCHANGESDLEKEREECRPVNKRDCLKRQQWKTKTCNLSWGQKAPCAEPGQYKVYRLCVVQCISIEGRL